MSDFTALRAALDAFKPRLVEDFGRVVISYFARYVETYGPTLEGIANSRDYAVYKEIVAGFLISTPGEKPWDLHTKSIDGDRLKAAALTHADETVTEWFGKIKAKVGEVENGNVVHLDGARFLITGTRGGAAVRIEQDRIINVSSKGKLFHQYPARLYVDGKFTSAAVYKKRFG